MKNFIIKSILILGLPLLGLAQSITYEGRWAEGHNNAVFSRSGLTFIGNGALLEIYETIGGRNNRQYQQVPGASILLSDVVEDIWVRSNGNYAYVACGEAGFQIIELDLDNKAFGSIVSTINTPGFCSGLFQYGNYLYIADGSAGLLIYYIGLADDPVLQSSLPTGDFAHDIWVLNDNALLIAAESSGIYSIDILQKDEPQKMDSLALSEIFASPNNEYPSLAWHVLANDTVAYVASRWGGLGIVDITNLNNLRETGRWTWHGSPTDVRSVFVNGDMAYVAAGKDGLYSGIDVSIASAPTGPVFSPIIIDGIINDVFVVSDTVLVASGRGGHQKVVAVDGAPAQINTHINTADYSYDAVLHGNYAYVASGRSGLKTVDLLSGTGDKILLKVASEWEDGGQAYGVYKNSLSLFLADGSRGLSIFNISTPANPQLDEQWTANADTCYDVHVPSGYFAFLACGSEGMRVIDYSQSPLQEVVAGRTATGDKCRGIFVENNKAYLAAGSELSVYNVSGLASQIAPFQEASLDWNWLDARDIVVQSDTVFVANGQYGVLLWNMTTDEVDTLSIAGIVTDIKVSGRTIYVSTGEEGVKIIDLSRPGEYEISGRYSSNGFSSSIFVEGTDIAVADGRGGLLHLDAVIKSEISVSDTYIDFGPVAHTRSRPREFFIYNEGTTLLTGSFVMANNASEFAFSQNSFAIPPGDTLGITITFTPATAYQNPRSTTLTILSNDPQSPAKDITLQWEGGSIAEEYVAYQSDVFTMGLWHFNETGGNIFSDASAKGHDGVLLGNPEFVNSGKTGFGNAIRFDENDDRGRVSYHSDLNLRDKTFTVEFWFFMSEKPDTAKSGYGIMLQRGIGGNNTQYQFALANENKYNIDASEGGVYVNCMDGENNNILHSGSINDLSINHWYHVALMSDKEYLRLYLNGVLEDSTKLTRPLVDAVNEPLGIGASAQGNSPFVGIIDEVRISNVERQLWELHVNRSAIRLSENVIDFGSVLLDESRQLPLRIFNPGSEELAISSIALEQGSSDITITPTGAQNIDPGKFLDLTLTYLPVTGSTLDDKLVIESSDPSMPIHELPISGTGIVTIPAGKYESDALTTGLWHFDEVTGSILYDSSESGLDGLWPSKSFSASAQFGRAIDFVPGENRIGILPADENILIGPRWGGFTVEGWILIPSISSGKQIIMARNSSNRKQFEIYLRDQIIYAALYDTSSVVQGIVEVNSSLKGPLVLNDWTHFAMTYTSDLLTFYLNGDKADEKPFTVAMEGYKLNTAMDTASVRLGRDWERTAPFSGRIDEVRISSVARQPWEFNVDMARVVFNTDTLDFDNVLLEKDRMLKLHVKNSGIDDLHVTNIVSTSGLFSTDQTEFVVIPGRTQIVKVTFSPTSTGSYSGTLLIETNDPFEIQANVTLTGTGIDTPVENAYTQDPFTTLLYHFDETSGEIVADSSLYASDGAISGDASWNSQGRFAGALAFDGANDKVVIDTIPGFDEIYNNFIVEFWFNLSEKPTDQFMFFTRGEGAKNRMEMRLHPSRGIVAALWDSSGTRDSLETGSTDTLRLNQWYHTSLSWNGDSLCLALNKVFREGMVWHKAIKFDPDDVAFIGAGNNNKQFYKGKIDEFRISSITRYDWEYNVKDRELYVNPLSLDFATVLQDQERILQVGIHNLGDQDLKIESISGGGTLFSFPENLTQFTLGQAAYQAVPVTYKPDEANVVNEDSLIILANGQKIVIELKGASSVARQLTQYATDSHTLLLYHFNESSGLVAADSSDNNINADLKLGAYFQSGLFGGNAVSFDGHNDYLSIPYNVVYDFDLSRQDFTLECYIQTDTVDQGIIYFGEPDSARFGLSVNSRGYVEAHGFGEGGGPQVNDGAWHHIALMFDHIDQKGSLFLDGYEIWERDWTGKQTDLADIPIIVGARTANAGFFNGAIDELRISDIPRERWEFQFIDYGIEITMPAEIVSGRAFTLVTKLPRVITALPNGVSIKYRAAGMNQFTEISATAINDTMFTAAIPADAVLSRGLEYYVEIHTNKSETLTYPILDPDNNPISLQVVHKGMQAKVDLVYRKYQMVSIPYHMEAAKSDSVLKDFGLYDPYKWELYWWDPVLSELRWEAGVDTAYIHVSDSAQGFTFVPGKAFWIASTQKETFNIGQGLSVTTDTSYQITIEKGWNMVANPYAFPISWNNCTLSDSTSGLYYHDLAQSDRPIQNWKRMDPWEGYWLHNPQDHDVVLTMLPRETSISAVGKSIHKAQKFKEGEWNLCLMAETEDYKDISNYAGTRANASMEWDFHDQPEPPAISNSIDLYFDHHDWEEHGTDYASDMRPLIGDGHVYNFKIAVPQSQKKLDIKWILENEMPEQWSGYIFSINNGNSQDISQENSWRIKLSGDAQILEFKLLVGNEAFIAGHQGDIPLGPVKFDLMQNYPNPFNPDTHIKYSLPKRGNIKIDIYNSLGQHIKTLIDEDTPAGFFETIWNGKDSKNNDVASGVYLCRLKADKKVAIKKMVLVR
ncbi:choice-of-anchor D domain-containing protein [bacterium]|nr:choice-of-anchor D domain-containing protein [bacterium]